MVALKALYRPPLLPSWPNRKFVGRPDPAGLRASAFSAERPRKNCLLNAFATRNPYCRAQTNPALYCESMVAGRISVPFDKPCVVSVANDHISPPVKVQPLAKAACAQIVRCLRT